MSITDFIRRVRNTTSEDLNKDTHLPPWREPAHKIDFKDVPSWNWTNKLCPIEIKYRHSDDCCSIGCPEHTFRMELYHVNDYVSFDFGDGISFVLDTNQIAIMKFIINELE